MKQQFTATPPPIKSKNHNYKFLFWGLIPVSLLSFFILLGFTSPQLAASAALFSFGKETSNINFKVNNSKLIGLKVKEATFIQMEQTSSVFSNMLQMSVADRKGNLVALSLNEVQEGKGEQIISTGFYFGNEHPDFLKNKSIDLGLSTFTNSSNLVLEKSDASSTVSRNGWIKIDECINGKISGSFHFEVVENGEIILSEGAFEKVELRMES